VVLLESSPNYDRVCCFLKIRAQLRFIPRTMLHMPTPPRLPLRRDQLVSCWLARWRASRDDQPLIPPPLDARRHDHVTANARVARSDRQTDGRTGEVAKCSREKREVPMTKTVWCALAEASPPSPHPASQARGTKPFLSRTRRNNAEPHKRSKTVK